MRANEAIFEPQSTDTRQPPRQIASWTRLKGFLAIAAVASAYGFYVQRTATAADGQLASHQSAVPIYIGVIVMDSLLLRYCWAAVRDFGGNLETLSGGRWTTWRDAAADFCVALPFWAILVAANYGVAKLLGTSMDLKSAAALMPRSPLEVALWIAASITAGICEELVFRGFLQRQFHALTGNLGSAILAQAVVFGLFHSYQGWINVIVVSVIGLLLGCLAAWRGNLRANMIAHAWTDIWAGWLGALVWR